MINPETLRVDAAEPAPARRSRGRPATRTIAEPQDSHGEAALLDEDGQPIMRRTRRHGVGNEFEIPERLRRVGWDYQWWPVSVLGQPIDPSAEVAILDGGWRPVRPDEMRSICPPGWTGRTLERFGQRLYKRPMHLTEEARAEDSARAREMRDDRLRMALIGEGGPNQAPRPGRINSFEVEETGRPPQKISGE